MCCACNGGDRDGEQEEDNGEGEEEEDNGEGEEEDNGEGEEEDNGEEEQDDSAQCVDLNVRDDGSIIDDG